MDRTVYIESSMYDADTLVGAVPQTANVIVVDQWTSSHSVDVTGKSSQNKGGAKKVKKTVYHSVLLTDQRGIDSLKTYAKVVVHRNAYPHPDWHDNTTFYVRLNPEQQIFFERIVKQFCTAAKLDLPLTTHIRDYSFVQFSKPDFLPELLGLLRAYDELNGSSLKYANKRKPQKNNTPEDTIVDPLT